MKSGWQYIEENEAREKIAPFTLMSNVFAVEGGQSMIDALRDLFYPVGSIKMTTTAENPAQTLGGTWITWGSGRVPVGVNADDADFASAEKEGGDKKPSHNHVVQSHTHSTGNCTLTIQQIPSHTHMINNVVHEAVSASSSFGNYPVRLRGDLAPNWGAQEIGYVGGGGAHNHGSTGTSSPNTSTSEVNVLQPYITCYMWKRTA